ncbi:MAG: nucleotidyltransferase family protein [Pseudomonadota bacterium]
MSEVVGILLAGGTGSRFGPGLKLLQPLADGRPVARAAADALVGGVDGAMAVVRPGQAELAGLLTEAGLEVVTTPAAERGMGASLAAGVAAAGAAKGWVIALADMPWIAPETVAAVAAAMRAGAGVAVPEHAGRGGHPVGFGAALGTELRALDGDRGARSVVTAHPHSRVPVAVDDPGIHRDVDRPADLPA